MVKIPQVKKRIATYIRSEEGKISKQSLISVGAFMGGAAIASILAAKEAAAGHHNFWTHDNDVSIVGISKGAQGTHDHDEKHTDYHEQHINHSSY